MNLHRIGAVNAVVLLSLSGCGPKFQYNDDVQGTVKMDGEPLAHVQVNFIPEGDWSVRPESARASTDDSGHFALTRDSGAKGSLIGPQKVVVIRERLSGAGRNARRDAAPENDDEQGGGPPPVGNRAIPKPYSGAATTPIGVDVSEDKHTYDIDLKSSGQ